MHPVFNIKKKKVFIKKTIKIPKYDEREEIILKKAHSAAFVVFWLIFVFGSVGVSISMPDKQIPTDYLLMQVLIAWWIYTCTFNISIFWQERRIGN